MKDLLNNIFIKSTKLSLAVKFFALLLFSSIMAIFTDWLLNDIDRNSTELFQQNLFIWCGLLSFYWALRNKFFSTLCIPFIYFFLLLDDSLSFHDQFSDDFFPQLYKIIFSLPKDIFLPIGRIGEIIYWFLILLIFIIISLPAIRNNSHSVKNFIKFNFAILFALSFFELFIDTLYVFADSDSEFLSWFLKVSLISIEELGAALVLTFACIKLFHLNIQRNKSDLQQCKK